MPSDCKEVICMGPKFHPMNTSQVRFQDKYTPRTDNFEPYKPTFAGTVVDQGKLSDTNLH